MKNKRRNHSAQFKAKVALAAVKGNKTIAELGAEYKVHPNQITQWKKQLLESLAEIFPRRRHYYHGQPFGNRALSYRLHNRAGSFEHSAHIDGKGQNAHLINKGRSKN